MDIITLASTGLDDLRSQLAILNRAVAREVTLPPVFSPPRADVVLLAVHGQIEVYMSAATRYLGNSEQWQEIMARQPMPGNARLVFTAGPDVGAALAILRELVQRAEDPPGPSQVRDGGPVESSTVFRYLRTRIVGQDEALMDLARLAARHLARKRPARPATVLALGPPGVGKTYAAQALAPALNAAGAVPGYTLFHCHDGRQLVDALRANENSVVVCDDWAGADPRVPADLLDAPDFARAIFVFTARADAGLSPELIGRISRILAFRPLADQAIPDVIQLLINRFIEEYALPSARVTPRALAYLRSLAGDDDLGAWTYRHLIDERLGDEFARLARAGVTGPVVIDGPPLVCLTTDDIQADGDE